MFSCSISVCCELYTFIVCNPNLKIGNLWSTHGSAQRYANVAAAREAASASTAANLPVSPSICIIKYDYELVQIQRIDYLYNNMYNIRKSKRETHFRNSLVDESFNVVGRWRARRCRVWSNECLVRRGDGVVARRVSVFIGRSRTFSARTSGGDRLHTNRDRVRFMKIHLSAHRHFFNLLILRRRC